MLECLHRARGTCGHNVAKIYLASDDLEREGEGARGGGGGGSMGPKKGFTNTRRGVFYSWLDPRK